MQQSQRSSYLQFTNIWNRHKDYEAHKRRLGDIKSSRCSPYNYTKHREFFDGILNHHHSVNKKNTVVRLENMDLDNDLLLKRLIQVTNKVETQNLIPEKRNQFHKKVLEKMYLAEENDRMKQRIKGAEPSVNVSDHILDYRKHLYYKSRMQKFYKDEKNKTVRLKALENVKYYEDPEKNRKNSSMHELQYYYDTSFIYPKHKRHISEESIQLLNSCGPIFINNKLQPFKKQISEQLPTSSVRCENLKKLANFFKHKNRITRAQSVGKEIIHPNI